MFFLALVHLYKTLTPQPPLPLRERGSKKNNFLNFLFPSPLVGEGLGERGLKTSA